MISSPDRPHRCRWYRVANHRDRVKPVIQGQWAVGPRAPWIADDQADQESETNDVCTRATHTDSTDGSTGLGSKLNGSCAASK